MKGNIRTKGCHGFKYTDKYNNTYTMILTYMFLSFFTEEYNKRSIRDICRYRVPPFMHEWWLSRPSYRQMYMCRNNSNIRNFDRDEYRYIMHYMGDYYG